MGGAGGEIEEKRFFRCYRVMLVQPVDRIVGQVTGHMVPLGRGSRRLNRQGISIKSRLPLTVGPGHESVVILKAQASRPMIVRTDRTDLRGRRIVPFTECGGTVAVASKHFRYGHRALVPDRI